MFVEVFCPKSGSGKYLTDADVLAYFLKDNSSPFVNILGSILIPTHSSYNPFTRVFACMLLPSYDIESFVTNLTVEWIKMRPWAKMDLWVLPHG